MASMLDYPYTTIEFADTVNLGATWTGLGDSDKQKHIDYASLFIDKNYSCWFNVSDVPDQIQRACSLLANESAEGNLNVAKTDGKLKKKRVKAGSVESEKEYSTSNSISNQDKYPEADLLMTGYCKSMGGSIDLTRI